MLPARDEQPDVIYSICALIRFQREHDFGRGPEGKTQITHQTTTAAMNCVLICGTTCGNVRWVAMPEKLRATLSALAGNDIALCSWFHETSKPVGHAIHLAKVGIHRVGLRSSFAS